jgi:glyoxylase-like metal-dependent hydrolase (beta-lactamase superfamily II)
MTEFVHTIQLGEAAITLINVGDLQLNLAEDYRLAEKDWPPGTENLFRQAIHLPVYCVLVQTPETNLLVDASSHAVTEQTPFAIPGYPAPPGLLARLAERGLKPEDIAHVVITHAHFDHYSGVTEKRGDNFEPCFPNARHYLGQADWDSDGMKRELESPKALPYYTFAVLQREGLLQPTSGSLKLTPGIEIIPAPGETLGHQTVRVSSEGQTFYALGDLYNHPIEVERPDLMSYWANADANRASREQLVKAALAENALLCAAHIRDFGRLTRTDSGVRWDAVEVRG